MPKNSSTAAGTTHANIEASTTAFKKKVSIQEQNIIRGF